MSKTHRENYRRPAKGRNRMNRPERQIKVRSVRRQPFDPRPLGRVAIAQALAEAEVEKAAATEAAQQPEGRHKNGGANDSE
ncbi:hypothetical protein ACWEPH_09495 [Nocardia beijingensis]